MEQFNIKIDRMMSSLDYNVTEDGSQFKIIVEEASKTGSKYEKRERILISPIKVHIAKDGGMIPPYYFNITVYFEDDLISKLEREKVQKRNDVKLENTRKEAKIQADLNATVVVGEMGGATNKVIDAELEQEIPKINQSFMFVTKTKEEAKSIEQ
jgi:hypothetical protein